MLQFLLSDNESLSQYINNSYVSIEDIKRRLFLKKRFQNVSIPDHLYRLEQTTVFSDIDNLSDLFTIAMPNFTTNFLEFDGKKIFVKPEKLNYWQEIITYIPPLWLQSLFLFKYTKNNIISIDNADYFRDYILPNTRYTSIPSTEIKSLDHLTSQNAGLHDLHMHLNGSLEIDQVWQDYLFNPKKIYYNIKKGYNNYKVKEQLEQEFIQLDPLKYYNLLKTAQKLREFFFSFLFPHKEHKMEANNKILLDKLNNNFSDLPGNYEHPFVSIIDNKINRYPHKMSIEVLMHILILNYLEKNPNKVLAGLLHFYLLILGLTNRLLVQQTHQNGFEQFQKHTLNELREESEKSYMRRFHQMHGNNLNHIYFLEGRFSPKDSQLAMVTFIDTIYKGWNKLVKDLEYKNLPIPRLNLIAHFIKKSEKKKDLTIRHKELRYDLIKRGRVLALLLKNHSKYKKKIVGIDAAASEFDAPPEVFAPLFRMMRREGIKHFTYHAGEDFYHILDGLRAIYEAINFCDLKAGDRIGHATASGLSVDLWSKVVGNSMRIKKGDYIDNLVFCYHLIIEYQITSLQKVLPYLINEVNNLCFDLYNESFSMKVLQKAWIMRQCCPVHTLEKEKDNINLNSIFNEDEWNFMSQKFTERRNILQNESSWKVYEAYHYGPNRERFDEIIYIDPFKILKKGQIQKLQIKLLNLMSDKQIIIETLPTSNIRIGFHKDFSTYHLMNWIKWKKAGKKIPPIVVGTDDTGIFSTNIYNEYANIYSNMINNHQINRSDAMNIIKELDENSRIYRFEFK